MNTQNIDFFNDTLVNQAQIFNPGDGEFFSMNGLSLTLKVTSEISNDQLGVYEITLAPQAIGAKLHYHRFMDETFIVTQGMLTIEAGQDIHEAAPGTVVYVPRFTPHGFRNDTNEEVKLMLLFNPAQKREDFFRGLYETLSEEPIDPGKYLKLYNKYDSFPVDTNNMLPVK
ncbi:cupin [marine bacterium AO1-C]|nr:cupin [marine bacterium AO1-C]